MNTVATLEIADIREAAPSIVVDLESKLLAKAGQYVRIRYSRKAETLKICTASIVKETETTLRAGVEYNNQERVIEGHESGAIEKLGLPESIIKLSKVLFFNTKTLSYLFGFCPAYGPNNKRERWLVNGHETSKENILSFLASKELSAGEMLACGRPCNRKPMPKEAMFLFYKAETLEVL